MKMKADFVTAYQFTFKLQVVTGGVSWLTCPPPPWTPCFNAQNLMKTPSCWRFVLLETTKTP